MNQQPKKYEELPPGQRVDRVKNAMPYVALTLLVWLRSDLGFRVVNPVWLFNVTLVEIVMAVVLHPRDSRPNALFIFALVTFALGMYQRIKRGREHNAGVLSHSFFLGTSCFRFAWVPPFLKRNRRVERFCDSIVSFAVGTMLLFIFPPLGFWLAISATCILVWEAEVHEREKNHRLDLTDGLINSANQGHVVEKFEAPPNHSQQRPESGLSTGLADDIKENINRRKSKQNTQKKG